MGNPTIGWVKSPKGKSFEAAWNKITGEICQLCRLDICRESILGQRCDDEGRGVALQQIAL